MRCLRESGLYAPSFLSPRTHTFVFQDFTSTPSREVAAHESHSRVTTENDIPSREAHARNHPEPLLGGPVDLVSLLSIP